LFGIEGDRSSVGEPEFELAGVLVDPGDLSAGAVAQLAVLRVVDRPADLDLIAGMQSIRPAGDQE